MQSIVAIIPVYNGAKYIERSIRSVLDQTVQPTEFIVVDDGSTDNSRDIIERMAAKNPSIRIITKPNGGQSSARNLGVASSTSSLIAFLDQDDAWYPDHLSELAKPFRKSPSRLGWVYSDLDQVDIDWNMVCHEFLQTMPTQHPKRDIVVCLQQDMFILPSAALITREAFESVGGFDERLSGYEDDDLFLRLFRKGYANAFVRKALSAWRIHMESTSYTPRMARSRLVYMKKLIEFFPDNPEMTRFYRRDCIAPRFSRVFVADYVRGLRRGDRQTVAAAINDLRQILPYVRLKRRLIFTAALPFLASYPFARTAFRMKLHIIARRAIFG
jgi:glycosyltransferase involved in cell wall biosynthesis